MAWVYSTGVKLFRPQRLDEWQMAVPWARLGPWTSLPLPDSCRSSVCSTRRGWSAVHTACGTCHGAARGGRGATCRTGPGPVRAGAMHRACPEPCAWGCSGTHCMQHMNQLESGAERGPDNGALRGGSGPWSPSLTSLVYKDALPIQHQLSLLVHSRSLVGIKDITKIVHSSTYWRTLSRSASNRALYDEEHQTGSLP